MKFNNDSMPELSDDEDMPKLIKLDLRNVDMKKKQRKEVSFCMNVFAKKRAACKSIMSYFCKCVGFFHL